MDIEKHIAYWRETAREDWEVARHLVEVGRNRHGLFFAHLSLEKILKAHVCKRIHDLAPMIHNLPRLAELAGISLDPGRLDVLAEMSAFQMEGRYPEALVPRLSREEALHYLLRAEEVFQWLMKQL